MVRRIAWFLALAGAVPFLPATAALFVSDASGERVPAITALVTYSAVILSFRDGIELGLAIRDESGNETTRVIALGLSTVTSLAAWAVLWLPSPTWQVGSALALFVAVWGADEWMAGRGLLPTWFVDLRTAVSAIVAAILAVALYRLVDRVRGFGVDAANGDLFLNCSTCSMSRRERRSAWQSKRSARSRAARRATSPAGPGPTGTGGRTS